MTNPINVLATNARTILKSCPVGKRDDRALKDARQWADVAALNLVRAVRCDAATDGAFADAIERANDYKNELLVADKSTTLVHSALELLHLARDMFAAGDGEPAARAESDGYAPAESGERRAMREVGVFVFGEHSATIEEIANVAGCITEAKRIADVLEDVGFLCRTTVDQGTRFEREFYQCAPLSRDEDEVDAAHNEITKRLDAAGIA